MEISKDWKDKLMETFLFIDTETSGFKKNGNLIQEGQARVCQLAMILTDDRANTLAQMSSLVRPEGWSISKGALNVHGKTEEMCMKHGISQGEMVDIFDSFLSRSTQVVAHNEAFDRGMMEVELAYSGDENPDLKDWFCTMKQNTHICGKWPKLEFTLQHYCGRSLGNDAHDAMADAKACKDIFFAMRGIHND